MALIGSTPYNLYLLYVALFLYITQMTINQEHKIGVKGFPQMRSKTITKAMIRSRSNPGCTTKLNTSSPSMTVLFTLFLATLATSCPLLLLILQFRLRKQPSILKSGVGLVVSDPMNTSAVASLLLPRPKRPDPVFLMVNTLLDLGLFAHP